MWVIGDVTIEFSQILPDHNDNKNMQKRFLLMDPEETLEYENIEEDLVDENDSEYENYGECESLSNTEKDESEFLFELDFNMLAESYEECDEIIAKLQNNEKLSPCVIIDMLNGEIRRCSSNCEEHSYTVMGKNIQVPCIGQGGHIYQHVGRGVRKDPNCDNMSHHENDTKKALKAIRHWILNIANSDKSAFQEKILAQLTPILYIINTHEKSNTI
ncbi:hypothetical protein C1645_745399 [Glomus cerebriforme]|uniref:Uncharacterized protein n=1 Tax=Glomus cerebriforme TaxID=658196 RepID=A0A397SCW0_9GLOM|nr:hypothetical protein C1645_745399 [Glomus cerebriforme]